MEIHCSVGFDLYAADADKVFQQAVGPGCEVVMPPSDLFRGDRCAKVKGSSGHHWGLATHVGDVEIEYEQSESGSTTHSPLQCALDRAALDPESAWRKQATEFDGAGIIRELMQVPVADRRFGG